MALFPNLQEGLLLYFWGERKCWTFWQLLHQGRLCFILLCSLLYFKSVFHHTKSIQRKPVSHNIADLRQSLVENVLNIYGLAVILGVNNLALIYILGYIYHYTKPKDRVRLLFSLHFQEKKIEVITLIYWLHCRHVLQKFQLMSMAGVPPHVVAQHEWEFS